MHTGVPLFEVILNTHSFLHLQLTPQKARVGGEGWGGGGGREGA